MGDPAIAAVLNRAADLIEPEGRWTQHTNARDANGKSTFDYGSGEAVCWCAVGAIYRVSGDSVGRANRACDVLRRQVSPDAIGRWNDAEGRTQAEVVAALREAALHAGQVK